MGITEEKSTLVDEKRSILDEYSNKVFKLVVLIVPIFFMCGNATMTIMYYMGKYPDVNDASMWVSNSIDVCYLLIGIYLAKSSYGPGGTLDRNKLQTAKKIILAMVVLQWNLNSYICPFEDFWAYAPLFVIVEAFFFDVKLVGASTVMIILSMIISWVFNGQHLLPTRDEFFTLNLIFRAICLSFTLLCINIITWFGKVFIIETIASREKEREMKEKSEGLAREARLKSDFLANMSHEIRTPMNAVIGMAEIAMREDLTPGARDCLNQIQKSGRNLLNIINDILDYSKIEAGKMEIVKEKYEPVKELTDIANVLATRVGDKKIELFVSVDSSIPHALQGDPMRIRQVLINLANNAIKFTYEGNVGIFVSCERVDEDNVVLKYDIMDTGIGIKEEDMEKLFVSFQQVDSKRNRSIEGTGLGLAISQRLVEAMGGKIGVNSKYGEGSDFWFTLPQKIMDDSKDLVVKDAKNKRAVFLEKETNSVTVFMVEMDRFGIQKGAISNLNEYKAVPGVRDYLFFNYNLYDDSLRDFLKTHSDITGIVFIDFNSELKPDVSNLYILRRPITTQKIASLLNDDDKDTLVREEEGAYTINITAPDADILIVDDNPINLAIAEGLLATMEMKIDTAMSGKEAIDMIKKKDYDIVFMDHMMPEMDGVDATKIIRDTLKSSDELVIIALTANAVEEAKQQFFEVGMNDFVAKPIDIKELVSKIKKWLPEEKIIDGTK